MRDLRCERGTYSGPERRRPAQAGQSPVETLMQLPALVMLERIPAPVLVVAHDGGILFANTAFREMLGYPKDSALPLHFHQGLPGELVELVHRDGFLVHATMTRSELQCHDDALALITFNDVTEQLWKTA